MENSNKQHRKQGLITQKEFYFSPHTEDQQDSTQNEYLNTGSESGEDTIYTAAVRMMNINLDIRKKDKNLRIMKRDIPIVTYIKNYCTAHVKTIPAAEHTKAAVKLIEDEKSRLGSEENILVVVPTLKDAAGIPISSSCKVTPRTIRKGLPHFKIKTVIVSDYSYMIKNSVDIICHSIARRIMDDYDFRMYVLG